MKCHYNDGFTLLELVMVLLIVGVAISIAAVSLDSVYEKNILRQEATRLYGTLRHAREVSLLHRAPVTFLHEEESGQFWLDKGGSVFGKVHQLHNGIQIEGDSIVFLPKGNSTGGIVTIADAKKRKYSIEVDPNTGNAAVKRLQPH